jgi:hypothetical protein
MPRAFGTALRAENYSLCESRTPISEAVLGDLWVRGKLPVIPVTNMLFGRVEHIDKTPLNR